MALTIFDTDILINVGRADPTAITCFQDYSKSSAPAVSAVTQMELIVGSRDKIELRNISKFLDRFEILPINEKISASAVELMKQYRLSHGLLIPDALIAATALKNNENFITGNQKDFRFISGLKLLSYP